ncbi:MAG: methylthioribulose 1-phosphate dehydratase [Xanthomonadales bacterium]|nr:methylthioribulose 1-phosphate dehydratase [Xanthomonadales bacterium]
MKQAFAAGPTADEFATCAPVVARTARELGALGWTPATSGNFSMRVGATPYAAITISGCDKRHASVDDIMLVDGNGQAVSGTSRPSAETALHLQIYRRFPITDMVLHTHSQVQSVASRLYAERGLVRLQGWELQKALDGHTTHDGVVDIPVFPNTQHMPELVACVDAWLDSGKPLCAYLIAGHGLYTWGRDVDEARRHLEALEFLLGCEMDLRRLQTS